MISNRADDPTFPEGAARAWNLKRGFRNIEGLDSLERASASDDSYAPTKFPLLWECLLGFHALEGEREVLVQCKSESTDKKNTTT